MALTLEQRQKIVQAAIKDAKAGRNAFKSGASSSPGNPPPQDKKPTK